MDRAPPPARGRRPVFFDPQSDTFCAARCEPLEADAELRRQRLLNRPDGTSRSPTVPPFFAPAAIHQRMMSRCRAVSGGLPSAGMNSSSDGSSEIATQQLGQLGVAGHHDLAALAAAHDAGVRRQNEAALLLVFVVATLAVLLQDRPDDVDERIGLLARSSACAWPPGLRATAAAAVRTRRDKSSRASGCRRSAP